MKVLPRVLQYEVQWRDGNAAIFHIGVKSSPVSGNRDLDLSHSTATLVI